MFMSPVLLAIGIPLLICSGYFLSRIFADRRLKEALQHAQKLKEEAQKEAESSRKEADLAGKELMIKLKQDFEKETKDRREEIVALEKRAIQKEENIERRADLLEKKEKDIDGRIKILHDNEDSVRRKNEQLDQLIQEEKQLLQKISSLSPDQAKELLLSRLEDEVTKEKATMLRRMEEEVKETAEKRAREIITTAIQRSAGDHTAETTITVVSLPSDEMKGRIIGREGRNIRALEMATGIDVIIDDTPEAVTISGFDMVRREIARITLEQLIADGRIHPGRIEEVVEKAKKQIEAKIKEEGEKAVFDLGVHDLHPELIRLVGRLKYRTSFGQNALQHTKEVAMIMGIMASQLGLDSRIAKRAGLLHDIGKVIGQEVEGTHAQVGADLAKKYGESQQIVEAVRSHHEEVEMKSIYGVLVCAADAISAARPGARAETLETYIKRLEVLEGIANSFKGVEKAFALQAGREIRIIVNPEKITDDQSIIMARDIKKKIEEGMEYPGQIKVIVIREKRAVEYAK